MNTLSFKTVKVDGLDIFYREAVDKNKPTILFVTWIPFILTHVQRFNK